MRTWLTPLTGAACAAAFALAAPGAQAQRPYSPTSFWNTPLADDSPLQHNEDGQGDTSDMSHEFVKLVREEIQDSFGPIVNYWGCGRGYSIVTDPAQPRTTVKVYSSSSPGQLRATIEAPIPSELETVTTRTACFDKPAVVWDQPSDTMYDMFRAYPPGSARSARQPGFTGSNSGSVRDTWEVAQLGVLENVSTHPGNQGSAPTGAGTTTAGGLLTLADLESARNSPDLTIPHALNFAMREVREGFISYPALRGDGKAACGNALPEGSQLRLPPPSEFDLEHDWPKWNQMPLGAQIIAKTVQRYGMYLTDVDRAVSFRAQSAWHFTDSTRRDPYADFFPRSNALDSFPWEKIQVLRFKRGASGWSSRTPRIEAGRTSPFLAHFSLPAFRDIDPRGPTKLTGKVPVKAYGYTSFGMCNGGKIEYFVHKLASEDASDGPIVESHVATSRPFDFDSDGLWDTTQVSDGWYMLEARIFSDDGYQTTDIEPGMRRKVYVENGDLPTPVDPPPGGDDPGGDPVEPPDDAGPPDEPTSEPSPEPGEPQQSPPDDQAAPPAEPPSPANPLAGQSWFVNPAQPAWRDVRRMQRSGQDRRARLLLKIARNPKFDWFRSSAGAVRGGRVMKRYLADVHRSTPTAVPQIALTSERRSPCRTGKRDGGRRHDRADKRWIRAIARAVGSSRAVIAFEPGSLDTIDCLRGKRRQARLRALRYGIQVLSKLPNATVYLEGGSPGRQRPAAAARTLRTVGVRKVRGFMVNSTHSAWTNTAVRYGLAVSRLVGGKPFVVNTSHSGNGPAAATLMRGTSALWTASVASCSSPNQALGEPPSTVTANPRVDAYLWIGRPGFSNGSCNGGPQRGAWHTSLALQLAQGARWD